MKTISKKTVIIIITMWPIKYLFKWMTSLSSDQNNSRNCGFCSSHPCCFCPFHLTHFTALSPPHLLFPVSQMIYHGSLSWTHTCFRIQAAISCPQSKMTWNSFAFFISFRSGLASLVSVGSCRIFKRMLYRDGALISSCNRMRPADKEDTYSMKNEFYRCNNTTCLICCYFKVSPILRRPQKPTGSRFSQQKKAHIHAFLFTDYWSSYSCLASKWTATDLSREFNTKQHIRTLLYQRHKMERTLIWIRLQKISIPEKPPKCWSTLVFHDTKEKAWNSFSSILMESCSQSRLSCISHTLQMCSDERASVCPACSCPQGARCRCHILSYNLHLSFLDHTLR